MNPHIWHSLLLYCREETGWWLWLKSTKLLCNVKTNSHFLPCRSCSLFKFYQSHLKSAITMPRAFHHLIAQQFSTIFSAGCYFSDYTEENHTSAIPTTSTKKPLCSGIMLHLFIFTYSAAFAIPQAKPTKQIFESLQCKNAPMSSSQVRSRR